MLKVDFHVHTVFSPDSVITFELLVQECKRKGIDAVAIMDHDEFEGACAFSEKAAEVRASGGWAPLIIKGEEVRTTGGEICGLFLREKIPRKKTPVETMELIKGQGGLVYVPHPFDLLKLKRLKAKELERLVNEGMIDIIEVFNGKPRFPFANILARRFLEDHKIAQAAGSDAHEPIHLGTTYVYMKHFEGPLELLESLRSAEIHGKRYSPLSSAWYRLRMWDQRKELSL